MMKRRLWPTLVAAGLLVSTLAAPVARAHSPEVTIWHAYGSGGSAEAELYAALLERTAERYSGITITAEALSFGDLYWMFADSAASGTPDLLVGPNDALGGQVRSGLVDPVGLLVAARLPSMRPQAIIGSTVDGRIYLIPQSLKAVALVYDREALPDPPQTTDEWIAAAQGGARLGLVAGGARAYYAYGVYGAFGGRILHADGSCAATDGGVAEALAWIRDARDAGVILFDEGWQAADALLAGQIDGFIEGNWRFGDFRSALGDDFGVVPGPSGPDGPFRPLVGPDGYVLNSASPDKVASAAVALTMSDRAAQRALMNGAGMVPADRTIAITDARVAAYARAVADGVPRPRRAEFDNYWWPFMVAFDAVVGGDADPDEAVANACAEMDAANGF